MERLRLYFYERAKIVNKILKFTCACFAGFTSQLVGSRSDLGTWVLRSTSTLVSYLPIYFPK